MSTMNISLPESLKVYVDQQVKERGYSSTSEFLRELIRQDQDAREIEEFRAKLLEGANSPPDGVADAAYFERIRERIRNHEQQHEKQ